MTFFYRWSHEGLDMYGHRPQLWQARTIEALPAGDPDPFYQLVDTCDFPSHSPELLDEVLEEAGRIEQGVIDSYEYVGDGFSQLITRNYVRFEHAIFNECPEWPIWYCTLAQYKAALLGYRQFLDLPESLDSELIVELPEGDPKLDVKPEIDLS
jgi:hypothetical protein